MERLCRECFCVGVLSELVVHAGGFQVFRVLDLLAQLKILVKSEPHGHPRPSILVAKSTRLAKRVSPSTRVVHSDGKHIQKLKGVRLADPSKVMAGSIESVNVTALSESIVETEAEEGESSGRGRSVEERIKQSKVHWSALVEFDNGEGEEEAEVSNVKEFEELQRHPVWGDFFYKFNQGNGSTLEVGKNLRRMCRRSSFIATSSRPIQSGMSGI